MSTSNDQVYYLDGDSEVKFFAPDGTTGHVTTIPGNATAYATFAVSPDDKRIAVSVFDYTSTKPVLHLYVEDLSTGQNHEEIFSSDSLFVWPVGWHDGKLVLEVGQAFPSPTMYSPYQPGPSLAFHVVDPNTARRLATLGTASCAMDPSLLSAAGGVCSTGTSTYAVDWNGATTLIAMRPLGASLSPDGTRIAACCIDRALVFVISTPGLGSTETSTGVEGYPEDGGWIDDQHVAFRRPGAGGQVDILDVTSMRAAAAKVGDPVVARLPGGL